MFKYRKIWRRILVGISFAFFASFTAATVILLWQQDTIVQKAVSTFNKDFRGAIVIGDTDISPFAQFPYVSIVIENAQVYEDSADMFAPILDVSHIYLGINFWKILSGNFEVNLLKVENGNFDIVRYHDGSFNLVNALSGEKKISEIKKEYNIELKKIELANLDIIKYDEETRIHAETYIEKASSKFKNSDEALMVNLNSQLILTVINDRDSTVFKKKHLTFSTELNYDKRAGMLVVQPSEIRLINGLFDIAGSINVSSDFDIDLKILGNNPNFNMLIDFAPEELIPILEQYENAGRIFFDVTLKGKSIGGHSPMVYANFGCDSAFFRNPVFNKKLEQISFNGYFTNGEQRNMSTMEFALENVTAKPEAGTFLANLKVINFESPEIEMSITSNFDLDFLAKFLNVTSLENLDGDVSLKMSFRDIIDLQNPEKALEKFSQSYFTELEVNDLTFKIPDYPLPFDSIDIRATMEGNHAAIDYIYLNVGNSDITIKGEIDNLPAIIHQTTDTITANLFIFSSMLNLEELLATDTTRSRAIKERINNLRLELAFSATARDLFDSPNLPVGNFYINNFYAQLEHYPHTLRKFNAHVIIGNEAMNIQEFTGSIDKSQFHYFGVIDNYPILLQDTIKGPLDIDFSFKSDLLRLNDMFTYNGENYVPLDYRAEEINDLYMYGNAQLKFNDSLQSTVVYFDQLGANLKVHNMDINDIHGKFKYQDEMIALDHLSGNIGNTSLTANMKLYLGDNDSIRKAINKVALYAEMMDYDQLSNYAIGNNVDGGQPVNPDSVFNIYTLPFTDLEFELDVDQFNYHEHLIKNINADLRIQKNQVLFIDTLHFTACGGFFDLSGYFDGSNADSIRFYPEIKLQDVDMHQFLNTFDNLGQDLIGSENIKGHISGSLTGKIPVYPNLIPLIEQSEIQMDIEIINGELIDYRPFMALSEYFRDKNLSRVRFDTLSNHFYLSGGIITIPNMTINSSLGHLIVAGTQDMNNNMEYYFRIPLRLVGRLALQKLFGKKNGEVDSSQIDEIQTVDEQSKIRYLNLKLLGDPDDFDVSIDKRKDR